MPLKGILIVGKDPVNHKIDNDFEVYKNNPDYAIIDAAQELMTQEEFRAKLAEYEIDSNTRIDIWAHGVRVNEREDGSADHGISLLSDAPLTKDVLSIISESGGNKPIQSHLWSCYGGTAARAVESLPEGSIVMGHAPEESFSLMDINREGIIASIENSVANKITDMTMVGQDLVANLPYYISQDLNIGMKSLSGDVLIKRLAQSEREMKETSELNYYFRLKAVQIEDFIDEMQEKGYLSSGIVRPDIIDYSEKSKNYYEYSRVIFNIFAREDSQTVDFRKLIEKGNLITKERAIEKGLRDEYLALLDEEFQKKLLSMRDEKGYSFLLSCIGNSSLFKRADSAITYLLTIAKKQGVFEEYSSKGIDANSPLTIAISQEKYGIAKRLIREGVKPDNESLKSAINKGDSEIAIALIKAGADINAISSSGSSVLSQAIVYDRPKVVRALIEAGVDVNNSNNLRSSVLEDTLRAGQDEITLALINSGRADLSFPTISYSNPFMIAMKEGKEKIIEAFLANNMDLNTKDPLGYSYLDYAIAFGDMSCVKKLVQAGMDVNQASFIGQSPLHIAASLEDTSIMEYLISSGANLEAKDNYGRSPIQAAIYYGNRNAVKLLTERGLSSSLSEEEKFRIAIIEGRIDEVERFIRDGISLDANLSNYYFVNPKTRYLEGESITRTIPFSYLAHTDNLEVAKTLISSGAGSTDKGFIETICYSKNLEVASFIYSLLSNEQKNMVVARNFDKIRNKEIAKFLFRNISKEERAKLSIEQIGKFADAEVVTILKNEGLINQAFLSEAIEKWNYKKSRSLVEIGMVSKEELLFKAIELGNLDIIENSIRDNVVTPQNLNLFFTACINSTKKSSVEAIIRGGFDIRTEDENGDNLLYLAIKNNKLDFLKNLSRAGIDLNQNAEPIMKKAAYDGNIKAIDMLLDEGVDVNSSGALHSAIESQNMKVFEKILSRDDIDLEKKGSRGYSPLFLAFSRNFEKAIDKLIERGCDVNDRNVSGGTALHLAVSRGKYDLVKILLEHGANLNIRNSIGELPIEKLNDFLIAESDEERLQAYKIAQYIVEKNPNLENLSIEDGELREFIEKQKINTKLRFAIRNLEIIDASFEGDPNGMDCEGKSMLSYAIDAKNFDAVRKLIEKGANVNLVYEKSGSSLLHEAAKSGDKEIYDKLVEAGANKELLDRDGRKPSEYLPETRVASAMRTSLDVSKGASAASPRSLRVIETKNSSKAGAVRG